MTEDPEERWVEVYQSEQDGQFYWRRWASRGHLPDEIVAQGEAHPTHGDAVRAACRENPGYSIV